MKKNVLIIIIILTTIIVLGGGIFAYTYFFTDAFLSEEDGFYKYISQNLQIIEMFKDEDLNKYIEKSETQAYSDNGELFLNVSGNLEEDEKIIADEIHKHKITFNGNVDIPNKYTNYDVKLVYDNKDIISGVYTNKNDYFGLMVNEIGLNKFITFENNNLKQFAKNMGLSDEEIASIPDKIAEKSIFTKEELIQIKERYLKAITDNLTENMFSKKDENGMTVYTLTVNEENAKNITIALIDTLKNDEMIFNKIKQIYIEQQGVTEEEAQVFIDGLKKTLEDSKNDLSGANNDEYENNTIVPSDIIQSNTVQQQEEKSENLYINVYVSKRNLVKTEFFIEDEGKFVINNYGSKFLFEFIGKENSLVDINDVIENNETQNTEVKYKTAGSISIEKIKNSNEISYKISVLDENNKELLNTTLTYKGLSSMTNIETDLVTNLYYTNSNHGMLNQAVDAQNETIKAQEKEKVRLALNQLVSDIYADSYTSSNEVVMNESTLKQALSNQGLDINVTRNEDGTYKLQSNTTGNIYTVDSKGVITNTEFAQNTQNITQEEKQDETISFSMNLKVNTTFGEIQQQDLTESNMYIINTKSYEQLQTLFNQFGERVANKFLSAYKNTTIGQMFIIQQ